MCIIILEGQLSSGKGMIGRTHMWRSLSQYFQQTRGSMSNALSTPPLSMVFSLIYTCPGYKVLSGRSWNQLSRPVLPSQERASGFFQYSFGKFYKYRQPKIHKWSSFDFSPIQISCGCFAVVRGMEHDYGRRRQQKELLPRTSFRDFYGIIWTAEALLKFFLVSLLLHSGEGYRPQYVDVVFLLNPNWLQKMWKLIWNVLCRYQT